MSDVSLFGIPLDSIKEVGTGLCAILVLVFSLRWLALKHSATLDARVRLLEKLLAEKDEREREYQAKIEKLNDRLIAVTEVHAHDMQALAMKILADNKENRQFMRDMHTVMSSLVTENAQSNRLLRERPCLLPTERNPDYPLGSLTPVPVLPKVPETDRNPRKA